jgi:hypothetical protein
MLNVIIGIGLGSVLSMSFNSNSVARVVRSIPRLGAGGLAGLLLAVLILSEGSAYATRAFTRSQGSLFVFEITSVVLLIVFAIQRLRTPLQNSSTDLLDKLLRKLNYKPGQSGIFALGVMGFCLFDVSSILEWLVLTGLLGSVGALHPQPISNELFAVGAVLGTVLYANLIAKKGADELVSRWTFAKPVFMLLLTGYFGYQLLFQTSWSEVQSDIEHSSIMQTRVTSFSP